MASRPPRNPNLPVDGRGPETVQSHRPSEGEAIVRLCLPLVALLPVLLPPGMCPCQLVHGMTHDAPLDFSGPEDGSPIDGCPCDHDPDCLLLDGLDHRVTVPVSPIGVDLLPFANGPFELVGCPADARGHGRAPPGRAAPPVPLFLAHRALIL